MKSVKRAIHESSRIFQPAISIVGLAKKRKLNRFNGFIALTWHWETVKTVEYSLVLFAHDRMTHVSKKMVTGKHRVAAVKINRGDSTRQQMNSDHRITDTLRLRLPRSVSNCSVYMPAGKCSIDKFICAGGTFSQERT